VVITTVLLSSGLTSIAKLVTETRFVIKPAADGRAMMRIVAPAVARIVPSPQFTAPADACRNLASLLNPTTVNARRQRIDDGSDGRKARREVRDDDCVDEVACRRAPGRERRSRSLQVSRAIAASIGAERREDRNGHALDGARQQSEHVPDMQPPKPVGIGASLPPKR